MGRFDFVGFEELNSNANERGEINVNVIIDKQTQVLYAFAFCGNAGGLTPLLDESGKPLKLR